MLFPKQYKSETLILIEPQRVPDNYVKGVISSDLGTQVSAISEMMISRTNLLKIIEGFNLFSGPEYSHMFLDEKIDVMRKRTTVDIVYNKKDRGVAVNAFKIAFEGAEPLKVMRVVNAMAALVIEQNVKLREAQAAGTVEFLDQELVKVRRNLEEVEATLKNFRENHMGELPEQLPSNLTVLERLQQH